MDTVRIKFE